MTDSPIEQLTGLLVDRRHPVPPWRPLVDALRTHVSRTVAAPGEDGDDEIVWPWNLAVPVPTAVIVAAHEAQDVAEADPVAAPTRR